VTAIDQVGTNNATLSGFALTGSTSNIVTQKNDLVTLPVAYLSFVAKKRGGQVNLKWSTVQEQNASHFTLQHSRDNSAWSTIANIPAAGNSNTVRDYRHTHITPVTGTNHYRLVLNDKDGKSSYSPVRTVVVNTSVTATLLSNTITDNLIRVHLNGPTQVTLYSLAGNTVVQKQLSTGLQAIEVNNLARGIYLLAINGRTEKIMLQ
jgi:hypothetical protein